MSDNPEKEIPTFDSTPEGLAAAREYLHKELKNHPDIAAKWARVSKITGGALARMVIEEVEKAKAQKQNQENDD
ncbi:hypothetical protein Dtox_3721 [Desulfofarcimen acetoxidans DSM 771]|uniref:Uncharacterized protein n=1 Tax=Desulfofarcimen acetoxidans (strain ATCC 49208 / DSM 771 / KCTC 5769 / VKM B-1644 / 5575) TaxID=485916 RepID=C8VWR5_DESAS|nr:hypothetical protein [Desulfofarcimen acetoxidans]ACV64429.1 hypothetical protein Dtox_3721 [Desulfofarcimen acetoxidans DSM 771]